MIRFRDLTIGETFDFVEDGSHLNSFFERCRKTGPRTYVAINNDGSINEHYGNMRVGTINVIVYHVKPVVYG